MLNFDAIVKYQSEQCAKEEIGVDLTPEEVTDRIILIKSIARQVLEATGEFILDDDEVAVSVITWGDPLDNE